MAKYIDFPYGVDGIQTHTMSATGTQAFTINRRLTIVDGATTEATGNRTLNLTAGTELAVGSVILLSNKTNGSETLTFGTLITDAVNTGSAGKSWSGAYMYNGTAFVAMGELQQID